MKKISLMLAAILLIGCTPSSLQKQVPIFSGHSSKSSSQVNKCLAPKWQELHPQATSIETDTGYRISAADNLFGTLSLALIKEATDGGSDVMVYAASRGIGDPWGNAAKACM